MRDTTLMGMESSIAKDERKFQLQAYIEKGLIFTLQSATQVFSLSEGTIITYLKEMNLQLWDAKKSDFVGAKEGKRVGVDIHIFGEEKAGKNN